MEVLEGLCRLDKQILHQGEGSPRFCVNLATCFLHVRGRKVDRVMTYIQETQSILGIVVHNFGDRCSGILESEHWREHDQGRVPGGRGYLTQEKRHRWGDIRSHLVVVNLGRKCHQSTSDNTS